MKRKKVSELAKQIRGVSYKTEDLHENLDENSVTLLRANNIFEGRINFDDVVYVDKSRVAREQYLCKGDILVCASSGSKQLVGKAASFNFDTECTFGAFCKVVRPNQDVANYLSMYFQSNAYRRKISEVAIGANINNIRNEHIDALELPIGSNAENEKVVASFSLLQQIIDGRKQQLHKLDELIKSRFIELFGDYNLTHPQDSWVSIKEIGTVVGGATPKTDHDEYWGGSYRWITPAELDADSGYIYDSVRKLTKAGVESCSLQEIPVGTVILSSRAPIGKVAIAGNTFYCNQGFKNIICKEGITPRYLYTVLLLNVEHLNSLGRGATFKEISKGIVENIRIPVPPIELQQQFTAFVEQTDKSKYYSSLSFRYCQAAENAYRQEWITCRTSDF